MATVSIFVHLMTVNVYAIAAQPNNYSKVSNPWNFNWSIKNRIPL